MIKKICMMVLTYLLILSNITICVYAYDNDVTNFDYSYDVETDAITIYGYYGTQPDIVIPEEINGKKVTSIADLYCFSMHDIGTLTIPKTVTTIENLGVEKIDEIIVEGNNFAVIDDVLYSHDYSQMIKCSTNVNSVEVLPQVITISENCFSGSSITSLNIPATVTYLGSINNVDFLKTITVRALINAFNFYNCPILETITLPETVSSFGNYSISDIGNCSLLKAINFDTNNPFFESIDGIVYKNNELIFYPPGKEDALYYIPDQITSLANVTTTNNHLREIVLNEKLVKINVSIFNYFPYLDKIDSGNNPYYTFIDNCLLNDKELVYSNTKDKKISIQEGVTSIGVKAFENNTYVEEIILPESLNEIKERAFRGCQNLTTINIPKNISNLHESYFDEESKIYVKNWDFVFEGCNSLKNITIDNENEFYVVEDGALYTADYKVLLKYLDKESKQFTVNDNTLCIESETFGNNNNLETLDLKNVTDLMYKSFSSCTKLSHISYDNVERLYKGYIFYNCSAIKEVTLPDHYVTSTTSIPIFENCQNLTMINFNNCNYYSDSFSFSECPNVTKVILAKNYENLYIYNNNIQYYIYDEGNTKEKLDEINRKIQEGTYFGIDQVISYHLIHQMSDTETNIVIDSLTSDSIDENTVLSVDHIEEGNDYNYVASSLENFVMYDITLTKDGQNVELDEGVEVKIPVAQGMNTESCRVYHLSDDNVYTDMNAVYKDGYMVFKTDHFSKYIVTDGEIKTKLGDVNEDGIINFSDAILVLWADSGLADLTEKQTQAADVNKDKQIDFNDAIKILQYDAGIITSF